jgi:hypothetical protein
MKNTHEECILETTLQMMGLDVSIYVTKEFLPTFIAGRKRVFKVAVVLYEPLGNSLGVFSTKTLIYIIVRVLWCVSITVHCVLVSALAIE